MNMLKDFSVIIILGIVIFIYWLFHKCKYKSLDNIEEYTMKELYSLFNLNKEARKKYRRHIPFSIKLLYYLCGAIFLVSIFLFGITAFSSIEEYYRTGKVTAPYIPAIWGFLINLSFNAMINAERSFKDYIKIKIEEKKYFESDEKNLRAKSSMN